MRRDAKAYIGIDNFAAGYRLGQLMAESGALGIAATRDGRLLTMRILRTRK